MLKTLSDDLETVSLEDVPKKRLNKSPSQLIHPRGLGIDLLPSRPSDSVIKTRVQQRAGSVLSISERPVSNESIPSSDFSENSNCSRNSSITSGSLDSSPEFTSTQSQSQISVDNIHTPYHRQPSQSTPSLVSSTKSNSTIRLTPSQRLKLQRQTSHLSRKERESYFEQHYDVDDDDADENDRMDEGLIWNVPFTKTNNPFSPTSGKSPSIIKNIIENSPVTLPMSPLPGFISQPSSPLITRNNTFESFYRHPNEAQSLSTFYEAVNREHTQKQVLSRKQSAASLPKYIKEASDQGLDDLQLVSEEKSKSLTSTRPIWLPPKPEKELKKHESDAFKMLEKVAKLDKKLEEKQVLINQVQERNTKKWNELNGKNILKHSTEVKKLSFKTIIPIHLRFEIWSKFLRVKEPIEKYQDLNSKLANIPSLPSIKIEEFKQLTTDENLIHLLKLKLISAQGLNLSYDYKLLKLLLLRFNKVDAYNLLNLVKLNVLTEQQSKKFKENLNKNSVLKRYLLKTDIEEITIINFLTILLNFRSDDCSSLIYQILDIVILNQDYKIIYAFFITIMRDYHYGFNKVDQLGEKKVYISDKFQFFDRFYSYYKKF